MKSCSIKGCPGHYETKSISHVVQKDTKFFLIENVPAAVCNVCGDTLLSLNTVRELERLIEHPGKPVKTVPVYQMQEQAA